MNVTQPTQTGKQDRYVGKRTHRIRLVRSASKVDY